MKNIISLIVLGILITSISELRAQFDGGSISGNVSIEAQSYSPDSLRGAPEVNEKLLSNAYLNLIYRNQNVEIGFRYENYQNPISVLMRGSKVRECHTDILLTR
ncbi:hypothetical protein MASR1M45_24610 [Candidatus Kapaibacterium sp.]